jgi:hypothetical protein
MTVDNSIIPDCITPAGLNEFGLRKNEIIIYPNPAKDFIRIKTDITEAAWYNIYNISGQLILSGNINGPYPRIKLPQLPAGLYVFQLENKAPQLIEIN